MRTTHELAKLLLAQPDMPCVTWGQGSDGVPFMVSADFKTRDVYIVDDEIRDTSSQPENQWIK